MFNKESKDDNYFIHFATTEECDEFKTIYKGNIGHTCCNGKGCLLKDVKSYNEIHKIKKSFINKLSS